MEKITKTQIKYQCSLCKYEYDDEAAALDCESRKVSHDQNVKNGDRVLITEGDGIGEEATVQSVYVIDKYWGHYAWERYWHTICITANLDTWGSRLLTYDSYKKV